MINIIAHGKPFERARCGICGCDFEFTQDETERVPFGYGMDTISIRCPICGYTLLWNDFSIRRESLMSVENDTRYIQILDHFGARHQVLKLAEEATELAHAAFVLYKEMNNNGNVPRPSHLKDVFEEMADVGIVSHQIDLFFHDEAEKLGCTLAGITEDKLRRTIERIAGEKRWSDAV